MERLFVRSEDTTHLSIIPVLGYRIKPAMAGCAELLPRVNNW
jgi:hypothetical protein